MTTGHMRTRDHLIYFFLLAMASCFASSLVLFLVLQQALSSLSGVPGPARAAILAVAVVWHGNVLWRRLTPALPAPGRLVATGQIRLPLRQDWVATLRMAGYAFLALAALELWRLLSAGYGEGLFVSNEKLMLALMTAKPVFAAFLGLSCLWAARATPSSTGSSDRHPPSRTSGRLLEGMRLCLHAAILATAGMLLGTIASRYVPVPFPGKASLASWGAHAGAIIAIHRMRIPPKQRWVLSFGLVAEGAGYFLLGAAGARGIMFMTVLLFERFGKTASGTSARTTWWDAARAAWGFVVGSLAGAMAGRLAGGLVFGLFGVVGPVTGEALGQVFLALAGYLALRRSDEHGVRVVNPFSGLRS